MMNPLPPDPVIEEICEIRHRISERFGHDPARLVEHYMQLEKEGGDSLGSILKASAIPAKP
jgi:hypothetical protein